MKKKDKLIFIVEDDKGLNALTTKYLKKLGFTNIKSFHTGEDAVKSMDKKPFVVIQDYDLPGINGLQVFEQTKSISPESEFLFMSGQTDIKVVIDILKKGAYDYVVKDTYAKENVSHKLERLFKIRRLEEEKFSLKLIIYIVIGVLLASWGSIFMIHFT